MDGVGVYSAYTGDSYGATITLLNNLASSHFDTSVKYLPRYTSRLRKFKIDISGSIYYSGTLANTIITRFRYYNGTTHTDLGRTYVGGGGSQYNNQFTFNVIQSMGVSVSSDRVYLYFEGDANKTFNVYNLCLSIVPILDSQ